MSLFSAGSISLDSTFKHFLPLESSIMQIQIIKTVMRIRLAKKEKLDLDMALIQWIPSFENKTNN